MLDGLAVQKAKCLQRYSAGDVAKHCSPDDCWVALRGKVYDVTLFLERHPGGASALSRPGRAGADVTAAFERIGHTAAAAAILAGLCVGELEEATSTVLSTVRPEAIGCKHGGADIEAAIEESGVQEHGGEEIEARRLLEERQEWVSKSSQGWHWHAKRRAEILQLHPEVQDLLRPEPRTLLLVPLLALAHGATCVAAQRLDSVLVSVVLAYTLGAGCKMWQFATAHEVCHGTVLPVLERKPECKAWVMHLCALPATNNLIHDYYTWMHLSHHVSFGNKTVALNIKDLFLEQTFDGDFVSVNVMKLIHRWLLSFDDKVKRCMASHHRCLFAFDLFLHLMHVIGLFWWALVSGLMFVCLATASAFAFCNPKCSISSFLKAHFAQTPFSADKSQISTAEAEALVSTLRHISLHFWLWLLTFFCLLALGPGGLRAAFMGLLYLVVSELCFSGFLHPYMGFWLGTHGTGTGDGHFENERGTEECQPTMSSYSGIAAVLTANLTYHVEHHDFPSCPWTRLPRVTASAPEFYGCLRQSPGLMHTVREYVHHGHTWSYACLH